MPPENKCLPLRPMGMQQLPAGMPAEKQPPMPRKPASRLYQGTRSCVEKARVYAPIKRKEGIEWKELHAGISRMMQYFCSEYKTEKLLTMGLDALNEIEKDYVSEALCP